VEPCPPFAFGGRKHDLRFGENLRVSLIVHYAMDVIATKIREVHGLDSTGLPSATIYQKPGFWTINRRRGFGLYDIRISDEVIGIRPLSHSVTLRARRFPSIVRSAADGPGGHRAVPASARPLWRSGVRL
jgi:hypothetical protein